MPAPSRILIVGAGIAGLALGRALRAHGLVPEIIERAVLWPDRGAGLYLPGNGVRALGALGLADKVLARAIRMSHQRILDVRGRLLAEVELGKLWNRVGCCVGIARVDLHRILLDGADGVPMRLGTTVTTLTQEADKVFVTFNDGSRGTYDLVVGADGIHSSIRQFVLPDIRPRHLGQVSWRFLVDESVAVKTWTAMLGPRQAFLALPVGPNCLYCYADLAAVGTEDPTRGDLDRLVALFKEFAHIPCQASSARSKASTRSTSLPSKRSSSIRGFMGVSCSLGMRRMRRRRTWRKVRRWRSRMRWCWRRCWRRIARRLRRCPRSLNGGAVASAGCSSEHMAGIASESCPSPFAISRSAWHGQLSIDETIDRCSPSHRRRCQVVPGSTESLAESEVN